MAPIYMDDISMHVTCVSQSKLLVLQVYGGSVWVTADNSNTDLPRWTKLGQSKTQDAAIQCISWNMQTVSLHLFGFFMVILQAFFLD